MDGIPGQVVGVIARLSHPAGTPYDDPPHHASGIPEYPDNNPTFFHN